MNTLEYLELYIVLGAIVFLLDIKGIKSILNEKGLYDEFPYSYKLTNLIVVVAITLMWPLRLRRIIINLFK